MKVFISWSGERSRAVAELLHEWIKCVLQATQPWMSARDIDRGSLWFTEINNELSDTSVGIICLTKENMGKPWILFEAGALAKGLSSSRVCTFLIDLQPSDLRDPLAQFNHTFPTQAGLRSLVGTLNSTLGSAALPPPIVDQVFATYWPQFQERFTQCLAAHPPGVEPAPKNENELLHEILDNTRSLRERVVRLEATQERAVVNAADYANASRVPEKRARKIIQEALKLGGVTSNHAQLIREQFGFTDLEISRLIEEIRRTENRIVLDRGNNERDI